MTDSNSDAPPIVQNSIKGLDAYVKVKVRISPTVGVKAIDDYTVNIHSISQKVIGILKPQWVFSSQLTENF